MASFPSRSSRLLPAALLAAAGAWVYVPALRGGWIWDDAIEVAQNPALRDASGLAKIWLTTLSLDYFPLKSTVQWLEWHAWGANLLGYHLLNVCLHVLGGILFAVLLGRLARLAQGGAADASRGEPWWAWLGGLLFVIHPLAVESVAWISELKNTLSLPPLLLSFLAYLDYDEKGRKGDKRRALLWFAAAMLSKTSVVMLPAALLLYGWWRRGRIGRRDLRASAGFFAIALFLGALTVWFQHHRALGGETVALGGWTTRSTAAGLALAFYLSKAIYPAGLALIYPRWSLAAPAWWHGLPWLGLALLAAGFWRKRAGWGRHALLGLGWFVLSLLPVLGFVSMAYLRLSWVADHLAYLALLAPIGLAAAAAGAAGRRLARAEPLWRWTAGAALATLCLLLAASSRSYAANFRDERAIWAVTVDRYPQVWAAQNDYGEVLLRRGSSPAARAHFEAALRLRPDYPEARNNLGRALQGEGRLPEAIAQYAEAVRLKPDYANAQNNWGTALQAEGRLAEATAHYAEAVRIDPNYAEGEVNLGQALARAGRWTEAEPYAAAAVQLDPNSAGRREDWGTTLARSGRLPEALAQFRIAAALRPDDAAARFNLGNAWLEAGRAPEAETAFAAAVRLRPDWAEAHGNLGVALQIQGRKAEALAEYDAALRLDPSLAQVRADREHLRSAP